MRFGETHNSTFNFDDFDISDASVNIPPIPRFSDHGGSLLSSTPYNNNQNAGPSKFPGFVSPVKNQENNREGKPFDSKLNGVEFAISESDSNGPKAQRTPLRANNGNNFGLGNILSPQIPASEVKRHFNDFSSAFNLPDDSLLYDRSIEVGRSTKGKHQPDHTFSSLASSRGDSPIARKVMDKPGSAGGTQEANSPDLGKPFYTRKPDSLSSNEKVTSSGTSPNMPLHTKPTTTFKIPTGYDNDASFFEKLGIKKPIATTKKQATSSETDGLGKGGVTLPDISGISSIFSSEESSRPKKRGQVQHKTLVSVPLDPDEKGEFFLPNCDYISNLNSTVLCVL